MRTHYLKTRLTPAENRALSKDADEAGLTVSEYVRTVLMREREAISVDALVTRLEGMLIERTTTNPVNDGNVQLSSMEVLLVECLMLLREFAVDRNVQILNRVSIALDTKYGKGRVRV